MSSKITYRQQYTRCGKQRCRKCSDGAGHGPYWYAYWSENGHTVSKYIGTRTPAHLEEQQQASVQTLTAGVDKTPAQPHEGQDSSLVLRIYVLGHFRVECRSDDGWIAVANRTWQRRRARALLGLLLSNSGRRLGREQAMEALWPDLDMDTAANRLNGAVHELRQILEPDLARPAASRMLRLERDVLILADSHYIWVDAEAFESLLNEANAAASSHPERVEQILEAAAELYEGDYLLEELYSEWATPRRESLRRSWTGLLLDLAEHRAARGALTRAIEPLERLLATEPTNETAVRRLMVLLTQFDRRSEALQVYQRLATLLQRDYDSDPLPETRELYEALRKGQLRISHPTFPARDPAVESKPASPPPPNFAPERTTKQAEHPHSREMWGPSARRLGRSNLRPLIGRERELSRMRQTMLAIEKEPKARGAISESRIPHLLLLTGETGIGKTRLAEELSKEANIRGWSVIWSRAYEQEGAIPYRLWIEILRALLQDIPTEFLISSLKLQTPQNFPAMGAIQMQPHDETSHSKLERLSVLLPELRDTLPHLRPLSPLPPEQERLHLWEATLWLLSALSKTHPLLFVLDDLHWADDSSLELLAYLVRHLQDQRILLAGTCRDMELTPAHTLHTLINDLRREQAIVTLPVQPLTQAQIASLVAHLPRKIVQVIQVQAAGNPFFAEELARYSGAELKLGAGKKREQEVASYAEEIVDTPLYAPGGSLPETIAGVLDRRLSRLSNECRMLLGKASVLGGAFELSQLLFMANEQGRDEDTMLDLLEEALRAGLLTEEGAGAQITYHFWHPLIVSHLYDHLSAARRAQLHRRAAEALLHSCQGHPEEVAAAVTHHLEKGSSDLAQIAHYAELAGNQAYTLSAYSEAQHYYRRVISIVSDDHLPSFDTLHLTSLLERVAECCMLQGDYGGARQLYERVLELRKNATPPYQSRQQEAQRQALILREIGRTWSEEGEYTRAYECNQQGKHIMLEAGVTSGAAWACLRLQEGILSWGQGNYEEAKRFACEALAMLEQAMRTQASDHAGLEPQTSELPTRTMQALTSNPLEVGRTHEILGITAACVGELNEALQHLNTALAIFEEHDLVIAMAMICGNLGAVYITKADYAQGRAYYHRSLELAERMGDVPNMAFTMGNLGDVAARLGNLVEAEQWCKRSLAISERINNREQMVWCSAALAMAQQDLGNLQDAMKNLQRALLIGRALRSRRWMSFVLVAVGDLRLTQAAAYKAQLDSAGERGMSTSPFYKRLLLRARGTLLWALAHEGLDAETIIEGKLALANVYFSLDDIEAAQQKAIEAMEEASQHEITRTLARAQRLLGRILSARGRHEEADSHFEQAIRLFHTYEMRLDYARTLHGYGLTLVQRSMPVSSSQYQKGLAYLREARAIFAECHAALDLVWVEHLLTKFDIKDFIEAPVRSKLS